MPQTLFYAEHKAGDWTLRVQVNTRLSEITVKSWYPDDCVVLTGRGLSPAGMREVVETACKLNGNRETIERVAGIVLRSAYR